ncbi:hypothetical protein AQI88_01190 [Streptomyces cellostaticus]|uniref:Uncharacterized protein n=1 Tax=Streptomyces cellostaticus TaxID=67285 RepID=A0A101NT83_9ACTN|nr:hypothetical protein [Streptomyces cellostaticus]KUM98890.1 hypothetical protein AQI88_01190 [Streptomyces cellostaticus]GHI03295.1 hypothetical protein Scel_16160 [Streptomyces cellostaticus]
MNRIRRFAACTAASTLLTFGALALASPAQAQDDVPPSSVAVSVVPADDTTGTGDNNGGGGLGGLLGGLLHVVGGLLGGLTGAV